MCFGNARLRNLGDQRRRRRSLAKTQQGQADQRTGGIAKAACGKVGDRHRRQGQTEDHHAAGCHDRPDHNSLARIAGAVRKP